VKNKVKKLFALESSFCESYNMHEDRRRHALASLGMDAFHTGCLLRVCFINHNRSEITEGEMIEMIRREDILSMEYLKKTEYTGSHQGMRFRLEKREDGEKKELLVTVWPEPFNFLKTPDEEKTTEIFTFDEDGVVDAIAWMNDLLFAQKDRWDAAASNWDHYEVK